MAHLWFAILGDRDEPFGSCAPDVDERGHDASWDGYGRSCWLHNTNLSWLNNWLVLLKKTFITRHWLAKKISLPRDMNMGEGIFLQAMWNLEMFFFRDFFLLR